MDLHKYIGKEIEVKIDRPKGSKHPKHGFVYEVNYGYVPETKAPDGEEIDAYLIGVDEAVSEYSGRCIAIIHRKDDDDDKLVVAAPSAMDLSDKRILSLVNFQEQYFDSEVIRK